MKEIVRHAGKMQNTHLQYQYEFQNNAKIPGIYKTDYARFDLSNLKNFIIKINFAAQNRHNEFWL